LKLCLPAALQENSVLRSNRRYSWLLQAANFQRCFLFLPLTTCTGDHSDKQEKQHSRPQNGPSIVNYKTWGRGVLQIAVTKEDLAWLFNVAMGTGLGKQAHPAHVVRK